MLWWNNCLYKVTLLLNTLEIVYKNKLHDPCEWKLWKLSFIRIPFLTLQGAQTKIRHILRAEKVLHDISIWDIWINHHHLCPLENRDDHFTRQIWPQLCANTCACLSVALVFNHIRTKLRLFKKERFHYDFFFYRRLLVSGSIGEEGTTLFDIKP